MHADDHFQVYFLSALSPLCSDVEDRVEARFDLWLKSTHGPLLDELHALCAAADVTCHPQNFVPVLDGVPVDLDTGDPIELRAL